MPLDIHVKSLLCVSVNEEMKAELKQFWLKKLCLLKAFVWKFLAFLLHYSLWLWLLIYRYDRLFTSAVVFLNGCSWQLIKMLGSWPVTSGTETGVWSDASWDLEVALNTAHLHSFFPFFAAVVGVDDKNSSSYVITVCIRILHIFQYWTSFETCYISTSLFYL